MLLSRLSRLGLVASVLTLIAGASFAQNLAAPADEVILTVTGEITATNSPEGAAFDRAMLEAIGTVDVTTTTIWTEGVHTFTGIPLKALVDRLGITAPILKMAAINDYIVEVPLTDAVEGGAVLAFAMDGAPMSVRDKGPVWLIYPFDNTPEYQSEVYYSRSIWQLVRIEAAD